MLFSSADEGVRTIVVTSAGPGEGKSLFSANLSVSLAQAGQRVLHVDADMRRPRVHEIFEFSQEPGLSNLLVGDCKPSEAVRKVTGVPGLAVLPAGMIPPNPAELLGSKRFDEYFATLSEHFDCVIIDSPPVLAVADASILANTASGVVFVVGADQTSRHAATRGHRPAARGAGARDWRGAESRRSGAQPVPLLDVLPEGIQPVLRAGAHGDAEARLRLHAQTSGRRARAARRPAIPPEAHPLSRAFAEDRPTGSMRILYLSSSGQLGGAERVLLDLAASLRRSQPEWELHLAAVEPGPLVSAAHDIGVAATVLPLPQALADLGESGASPGRVAWQLAGAALPLRGYVTALRRHIATIAPTIVHSHGLKTHVVSALAAGDAPLVWHLHDYVGAAESDGSAAPSPLAARRDGHRQLGQRGRRLQRRLWGPGAGDDGAERRRRRIAAALGTGAGPGCARPACRLRRPAWCASG